MTRGRTPKKKKSRKNANRKRAQPAADPLAPPLRPLERLLYEAAGDFDGEQILLTSTAGAQAAAEVARRLPAAQVTCNYFDVFLAQSARERWNSVENLNVTCLADLPEERVDCVALALPARGENQLARELIQTARLRLGATEESGGAGRLFVSTDNPKDSWVHDQLKEAFGKVTNRGAKDGRLYIGAKPKPLKKIREFHSWFAFRDAGRLFDVMSRPGVFSHRKLDVGARALIESLTVSDGPRSGDVVRDGARILDLGCGSGAVGFAASCRAESVRIHALDANARALACAQAGADRNRIDRYTTQLECAGESRGAGTFDLVLANPPYFSNYRIAELFVKATRQALKPGGRTHFVTKQPKWYIEEFAAEFDDVSVREVRGYFIVKGTQATRRGQNARGSATKSESRNVSKREAGKQKSLRGDIPKAKTKTSIQARRARKSE